MRITKIETQKKRAARKNVYVDGAFALGISAEALLRSGLRQGDEITPLQLRELEETESRVSARAYAMRLLSYRPRSVKELNDRMNKKEIPGRMIEEVIGDLRRSGLVDDGLFARTYLRDQLLLRPGGKLLLRRKLRSVGIGPAVAEEAINEVLSDGEHRAATDAARKFLSRRPRAVDPAGTRKRLAAFLARRGFEWETIRTVLREIGLPVEENG